MYSITLRATAEQKDFLIEQLWSLGSEGIRETGLAGGATELLSFFEDSIPFDSLMIALAPWQPQQAAVEMTDWVAVAQAQWQPFEAGRSFYLVPEWRDDPAPEGRKRIFVNPGLACGTGSHQATRLCLELMEDYARPGEPCCDVGCGSGILTIAASHLGAAPLYASDDDPEALPIAGAAFARAGIHVQLRLGSARDCGTGGAALTVCNISAPAAIALAEDLLATLRPGGRLVVSGFEIDEARAVLDRYASRARLLEQRQENSWTALVFERA